MRLLQRNWILSLILAVGCSSYDYSEEPGSPGQQQIANPGLGESPPAPYVPPPDYKCVPQAEVANVWEKVAPPVNIPSIPTGLKYIYASGYGSAVLRPARGNDKFGTIVYMDGIMETSSSIQSSCMWNQTYYANAMFNWSIGNNEVDITKISNFGGSSYGGGCLRPEYSGDMAPSPRHTYDAFTYVQSEDAIYMMLGANWRLNSGATAAASAELQADGFSTWKYTFVDNKWRRIDGSIREFWSSSTASSYESHMRSWPEGNRLLYVNASGRYHAEFDLDTEKWSEVTAQSRSPFSLYNAQSTWDSKRERWVFRHETNSAVAYYDPSNRSYTALPAGPSGLSGSRDIVYISRWDVYLIVGSTGTDTAIFDPANDSWFMVDGGAVNFRDTGFKYLAYDPYSDTVGMVVVDEYYTFRFVPDAGRCVE